MKKSVVIVGLIMCMSLGYVYSSTKDVMMRTIVSNHTRALDRANMYEKPLDNVDLQNWDNALLQVKNFVVKNSKKRKKQLLNYFNKIESANRDLINTIKTAYGLVKSRSMNDDLYLQYKSRFAKINESMVVLQKNLEWVSSSKKEEQEAIYLVGVLAKFMGVTARKAANNLPDLGIISE